MPRPRLFADEATASTVATLRTGDFLVGFTAQRGIAGATVDSGIATMAPEPHYWAERGPGRGQRFPVDATRITTLRGDTYVLPNTHTVSVRRRLAPAQ